MSDITDDAAVYAEVARLDRYIPQAANAVPMGLRCEIAGAVCNVADDTAGITYDERLHLAELIEDHQVLYDLLPRWANAIYVAAYAHALADMNDERIVV